MKTGHWTFKRTHGEGPEIKEYRAWRGLKTRCLNKKNAKYPKYGGRGITVCDRWLNSYENFLADMGRSPSPKHSVERKDNNGNYEPGNCRWATDKEQANNRRSSRIIQYNGQSKTIAQWADEIKIDQTTLLARITNGWSIGDAITKPLIKYPKTEHNNQKASWIILFNGESKTLKEWAKITGIHISTIKRRLLLNWDTDKALTLRPKQ